jgi:phenylpyruvate tautomerase PptA (4-oxalocrotonate tautomerase family)
MEKILDLQNQSSLAKLLATENITVTHQKGIKTAYFDVKNRVLGLPVWKDKGKVVYDMLVGHEVSHALYTPQDGFEKFLEKEDRKHFDILNIIEDIRIERLIKNKYAGMPRIFKGAYKELVDNDFFGVKDKDILKLGFLDRLNLRGKIGNIVDIPLNDDEEKLYQECYKAETFEDVIELYHKVKKFAEEEAEAKKQSAENNQPEESSNEEGEGEQMEVPANGSEDDGDDSFDNSAIPEDTSNEADDGTESHSISSNVTDEDIEKSLDEYLEQRKSEETSADDGEEKVGQDDAGGKSDSMGEDVIIEPETLKSLEENLIEEGDEEDARYGTQIALWPTKQTVDKHIIGYKKVMEARGTLESLFPDDYYNAEERAKCISRVTEKAVEFKKKTNKKVGVLVREFERRKAAYQYSRAQESRRGTLDVNKLHKYKYDDQIFESVMSLADAKSHGMIFFIDYSGSMSGVLKDVLEHTLNLVHFCKKVGIPFKVYSFTSNYSLDDEDISQSDAEFNLYDLVLAELFSSEMSTKEYNEAFQMVSCQIINSNDYRFSQQGISKFEHLGGTPLDATLIAAHKIVDDFRKKNPVQKLNVIVLTDGESQGCSPDISRFSRSVVTNVGGKQRKITGYQATTQYLEILKDVKNVNTIGFFLPNSKREGNQHLNKMARHCTNDNHSMAYQIAGNNMKKYRKDNYFHAANCFGYNSYFLLSSDVEIEDTEFDFNGSEGKALSDNRGEQAKLARQFAKHNVSNRTNRIIMTKFAEIIA